MRPIYFPISFFSLWNNCAGVNGKQPPSMFLRLSWTEQKGTDKSWCMAQHKNFKRNHNSTCTTTVPRVTTKRKRQTTFTRDGAMLPLDSALQEMVSSNGENVISFHYRYGPNDSLRKIRVQNDFGCPFKCGWLPVKETDPNSNYIALKSLLLHLENRHIRFSFTFASDSSGNPKVNVGVAAFGPCNFYNSGSDSKIFCFKIDRTVSRDVHLNKYLPQYITEKVVVKKDIIPQVEATNASRQRRTLSSEDRERSSNASLLSALSLSLSMRRLRVKSHPST